MRPRTQERLKTPRSGTAQDGQRAPQTHSERPGSQEAAKGRRARDSQSQSQASRAKAKQRGPEPAPEPRGDGLETARARAKHRELKPRQEETGQEEAEATLHDPASCQKVFRIL